MSPVTACASLRAAPGAPSRAFRRGRGIAIAQARDAFVQAAEGEFRLLEVPELLDRNSSSLAGSADPLDPVLAREVLDRRDASLDLFLPRRIGVEALEVGAELRCRLRAAR